MKSPLLLLAFSFFLLVYLFFLFFFFFNDTATTEIYTLSLHDALPIFGRERPRTEAPRANRPDGRRATGPAPQPVGELVRSEEHTSELQSRQYLVCRLLLEKKKTNTCTLARCDTADGDER